MERKGECFSMVSFRVQSSESRKALARAGLGWQLRRYCALGPLGPDSGVRLSPSRVYLTFSSITFIVQNN